MMDPSSFHIQSFLSPFRLLLSTLILICCRSLNTAHCDAVSLCLCSDSHVPGCPSRCGIFHHLYCCIYHTVFIPFSPSECADFLTWYYQLGQEVASHDGLCQSGF